MIERFTAAAIATLDGGRIGTALEQAIKRAHDDCQDRPGVDKPRKVALEITLTPVLEDKVCDTIAVDFQIKETTPPRQAKSCGMTSRNGELFFNDLSLDDPNQGTFDNQQKGPAVNAR